MNGSKILIMGLTFKENVADTRENPVHKVISLLKGHGCRVFGYDPLLTDQEIAAFDILPVDSLFGVHVDAVIMTVVHDVFQQMDLTDLKKCLKEPGVLVDVRGHFSVKDAEDLGMIYRTL